MRETITVVATGIDNPALGKAAAAQNDRERIRKILRDGESVISGSLAQRTDNLASVRYSTKNALVPVTFAAVEVGDTVTLNGIVLTATQARATCTLTLATVLVADTCGVNGVTFTAVSSATPGLNEFSQAGSNTADAASLAASINASVTTGVQGLLGATSATAIVTVYALAGGETANSYAVATSNSGTIARSNSVFTGGAAIADNQFDYVASNAVNAGSLATALAASSSTLVSGHVVGSNRNAVVTCATSVAGDYVVVDGSKLLAVGFSTLTGSAQIDTAPADVFEIATSDSNAGSALAACINSHPVLAAKFYGINASGAVTIIERSPTRTTAPIVTSSSSTTLAVTNVDGASQMKQGAVCLVQAINSGEAGNSVTVASSDATRLPINSQSRLTGGSTTTATF